MQIITDGWAAYKRLAEHGFQHQFVNHFIEFVKAGNPTIHTNTIEGRWWRVKRFLPSSGRYSLEKHLPMYISFEHLKVKKSNLFLELLKLVKVNNCAKLVGLKEHCDVTDTFDNVDVASDTCADDNPPEDIECSDEKFCLFCEEIFTSNTLLLEHMNSCQEQT